MGSIQIVTTVLAVAITAVAVGLAVQAVRRMLAVIRVGQPDPERFTDPTHRPVPIPVRWILGLIDVDEFLALRRAADELA